MFNYERAAPDYGANTISSGQQRFPCGFSETAGLRKTMDDAMAMIGGFAGEGTQFYAVYDGHGGNNVSHYAAKNLHKYIKEYMLKGSPVEHAIKESYVKIHDDVSFRWPFIGSTAATVVIVGNMMYCANVGDSRIVYTDGNFVKRLSYDHKASDAQEAVLVRQRGGNIYMGRVNGILTVSRALGDGKLEKFLTPHPFQIKEEIVKGSTLIVACDGVWDVLNDVEASEIAHSISDPNSAASKIMEESLNRGTKDNVSVLCVKF